jgi:hypothetical protein
MAEDWERRLGWIYETIEVKGHTSLVATKVYKYSDTRSRHGKMANNLGVSVKEWSWISGD